MTETIEVTGEAPVVDTTSTQNNNAISQDLLYNMPLNRFAPDLLNYAPGINNGSAFGGGATAGGSGTGNALLIDGVDTRDPEGGTAWSFFNYNVIEEVQVQGLGAPAEYGSYSGAVVNSITKSGGNNFSGLFDVELLDREPGRRQPSRARSRPPTPRSQPSKTTDFLDWTAQIGGPLQQDKLFFFLSAQRYHLVLDPDGPRTKRDELSAPLQRQADLAALARTTTSSPTSTTTTTASSGRPGFDSSIDTDAQTVREDAPEWVWNVQWRHLFGSQHVPRGQVPGLVGLLLPGSRGAGPTLLRRLLQRLQQQPRHRRRRSSGGTFYYADRGRHEAHASISHYAEAFGHHDMKFGVQIERSKVRSRYGYPTGFNYYDYTA